VLRKLGAKQPVRGFPGTNRTLHVSGRILSWLVAMLVIGSVLQCLDRGVSCHVLGGTRELERVLEDVKRVKQGAVAQSPELLRL